MRNLIDCAKLRTEDLVKITNNQVTTNSKIISDVFCKIHRDVIRAINNLDIPEDFRGLNFKPSSFHSGTRDYPMYEITRDGFTLLAMGFTGKKAMEWKIKYINAFNAMEKALTEKNIDKPVLVSEHTRALPSPKKEIVLSEKAKQEIGGIVKAVMQAQLNEVSQPNLFETPNTAHEELKALMREVIREEVADYNLKGGIKETEAFNNAPTANGLPLANWLVGISHAVGSINSIYDQMRKRQIDAVKVLSNH